jgi:hypothetical protein
LSDDLTKACINLHAVLRNLEDLCYLDPASKAIINGKDVSIQFDVRNIPPATLSFHKGQCVMKIGNLPSSLKGSLIF